MLKHTLHVLLAAGTVILLGWAYLRGKHVPISVQWPLFEALRTTAAIIFAVVGAWLAVVYPDRLRWAFLGEWEQAPHGNSTMNRVLSPAIHSTFILCIVLLLGVIAPLAVQIDALQAWKVELRGLSYVLLVALTLWQLATIIKTLPLVDQIKSESDKEALRVHTAANHFSGTHRQR